MYCSGKFFSILSYFFFSVYNRLNNIYNDTGGVLLKIHLKRTEVALFVAMFMAGCSSGTDTESVDTSSESKGSAEVEVETTATNYEEYPLPILPGWEEEETSFKNMGNGTIDLWKGQFTFEEEIDVYFEPYQEAVNYSH